MTNTTHGTRSCYQKGCRQTECVTAANEYRRKWRASRPDKEREQRRKDHRKWRETNPDNVLKQREKSREWRRANPDRAREGVQRWCEANRDKLREHKRQYRAANVDKVREREREWAEANRDKLRENYRRWAEVDPDRARAVKQRSSHSRRARARNAFIEAVDPATVYEQDHWVCHICGEAVNSELTWPDPLSVSLDHITPLIKGGKHSYENCATAHLRCNQSKGARTAA